MTMLRGFAVTAVIAIATALVPALGAEAAPLPITPTVRMDTPPTQYVQFSKDDIAWSSSYTDPLFADAVLVPGGFAERSLYVRNASPEPALLHVTLFDVATTAPALAGALSLTTSTPTQAGTPVPATDARPCATLTEGQTLGSGDDVRLDTVAALADLNGTLGQDATVSFKIAVTLSSTDSAAPAPNTCPADLASGMVVGMPDAGGPTSSTSPAVYRLGRSGWTSTVSAPTNTASAPESTSGPTDTTPFVRALTANTERLYQENIVALWLALAVLGALILLFVRRRRAKPTDPTSQPTQQIGTGR